MSEKVQKSQATADCLGKFHLQVRIVVLDPLDLDVPVLLPLLIIFQPLLQIPVVGLVQRSPCRSSDRAAVSVLADRAMAVLCSGANAPVQDSNRP